MAFTRTASFKKAACLIFSVSVIAYLLFIRYRLIFSYSVDLDGAEFTFIHFMQLLLDGKSLYADPCEFPFLVVMYAPVYPYLLYTFGTLAGFTADTDVHSLYVLARSMAFACMFVNLFFIYKIFKRLGFSVEVIFLSITFYLLFITGHFYVVRPDAFKVTFFTLFLLASLGYLFYNRSAGWLALAVCAGIFSILLKQDVALYIFLFAGLALFYLRNKKAVHLLLGLSFSLAAVITGCRLAFGSHFFENTFLFNFQVTTNIALTFNTKVVAFSIARSFPLLLILFSICHTAIKNFHDKKIEYFIALAGLLFFILSHITMFRAGAYLNYTFETILLLVITTAIFLRSNWQYLETRQLQLGAALLVYAGILFGLNTIIHSYTYDNEREAEHVKNYQTALSEKHEVSAIIQGDTVFFPNPRHAVVYPKARLMYGYEMHFDRLVELLHGLVSSTRLLFVSTDAYDTYFTQGRVKYIVTENSHQGKMGVEKYYKNYTLFKSLDNLLIYQYNQPQNGNN